MYLVKLKNTSFGWMNCMIGVKINTMSLAIHTPVGYVEGTVHILTSKWYDTKHTWFVLDMELLIGCLGHIADTSPWLRFLMPHLYISITFAPGEANANCINVRKDFCAILKLAKGC